MGKDYRPDFCSEQGKKSNQGKIKLKKEKWRS
jgi:hypothetical protein